MGEEEIELVNREVELHMNLTKTNSILQRSLELKWDGPELKKGPRPFYLHTDWSLDVVEEET